MDPSLCACPGRTPANEMVEPHQMPARYTRVGAHPMTRLQKTVSRRGARFAPKHRAMDPGRPALPIAGPRRTARRSCRPEVTRCCSTAANSIWRRHGRPDARDSALPQACRRMMTTRADPQGRPTVFERLPAAAQWPMDHRGEDWTSTHPGCCFLQRTGELAHRLMHPSSGG